MGLFASDKLKVLSIDDSKFLQMTTKNMLQKAGCKVFLAFSGEEGIKMAEKVLPDIILLDVTMPGMDGIQACLALKENPKTYNIPIIMVTSEDLGAEVEKAFEHGAKGYIIKPINAERLLSKMEDVLNA